MAAVKAAGVDTIVLSWWGQKHLEIQRDSQGVSTDDIVPSVLHAAAEAGVHVSWHIEPYGGRTPHSIVDDILYIYHRYGRHPANFRQLHNDRELPLFFLYDVSAQHASGSHRDWQEALAKIRNTEFDAVILSLLLDERDVRFVNDAGFDGAYTYFASTGFTYGSTPSNWGAIRNQLHETGKLFVPSVSPGYNDTLIRPWNGAATRSRDDGKYYDGMWSAAVASNPAAVSITSWNEWGEGTQIEPAREYENREGLKWEDYGGMGGEGYLDKTQEWSETAKHMCENRNRLIGETSGEF
jgi:glycoprotein endo-alpha-1,2-mannosidase